MTSMGARLSKAVERIRFDLPGIGISRDEHMFVTEWERGSPWKEVNSLKAIKQKILVALCIAAWTDTLHVFLHDLLPLVVRLLMGS